MNPKSVKKKYCNKPCSNALEKFCRNSEHREGEGGVPQTRLKMSP